MTGFFRSIAASHRQSTEPKLRRLVPPDTASMIGPDDVYRDLELQAGVDGRPYVVMNMVSTVDGKSTLGGTAAGIGSRTDARLMRQVRAAVDAIVHGAGTLRAEIVDPRVDTARSQQRVQHGLPPQPLAVAVSGSLDLQPTNRFFVNGPARTVILTTVSAARDHSLGLERYAAILGHGEREVDLAAALRQLYDAYGVRRLLSEGGPTLNQRLLEAGLIDEVFWTIAPKLAGGSARSTIASDEPTVRIQARLDLVSLHEHDGEMYARYRLRRGSDGDYVT